jgi:thioredoxin-related protein
MICIEKENDMFNKTIACVGVLVSLVLVSCRAEEKTATPVPEEGVKVSWLTSLDTAKAEAAARKVPILVDFSGSDWCGWCIRLDKEVFSKPAFRDYAKGNLVLLLLDFPRGKAQSDEEKKVNRALAEQFRVEGFPTVLLLSAEGNELARTGYQSGGAEAYVQHLKSLINK